MHPNNPLPFFQIILGTAWFISLPPKTDVGFQNLANTNGDLKERERLVPTSLSC